MINDDFVNKLSPETQLWWKKICEDHDKQRQEQTEKFYKELEGLSPQELKSRLFVTHRVIAHFSEELAKYERENNIKWKT